MTEHEFVKKCLHDICSLNGFADSKVMTQRDFEWVSHQIEEKTGTLISVSTIKRLLNGSFSHMPQVATLNAISNYLGHKNWQAYKISYVVKVPEKRSYWKWGIFVGILVMIILGFSQWHRGANYDKAQFSAVKTTRNDIPNTVVFHYNVDDVNADSFFIQQSWDKNRRVRVYKHQYTLTDIYYEPGYHTAKLIANDRIIKTFDVSIPTDNWFFCAEDPERLHSPVYIKTDTPWDNGVLSLHPEALKGISMDVEKRFVYAYFPGKIVVSSDDYIYHAKVRVREVRRNFCPYLMCEVFCQRYFMYFVSTASGCVSNASAQFGDVLFDGKRMDLSSLGMDVREWVDVRIVVKDKGVYVWLDGRKVLSGRYGKSAGRITGLGFLSNGVCEVKEVELKGLDGEVVYEEGNDN